MDDIDVDMNNESIQNEILGVEGDVSQHPIALDGAGSQPPVAADIPTLDSASLPTVQSKKRKPNASGPRKTSAAWESFTKLPESECPDPTATCNYCVKMIF
ncbi:hypothetical protein P8452_22573 [Trifolium repens]|nr:hypothetical protein P8452_22573 [Trifolium repens]